jgi:hypothetical protein
MKTRKHSRGRRPHCSTSRSMNSIGSGRSAVWISFLVALDDRLGERRVSYRERTPILLFLSHSRNGRRRSPRRQAHLEVRRLWRLFRHFGLSEEVLFPTMCVTGAQEQSTGIEPVNSLDLEPVDTDSATPFGSRRERYRHGHFTACKYRTKMDGVPFLESFPISNRFLISPSIRWEWTVAHYTVHDTQVIE